MWSWSLAATRAKATGKSLSGSVASSKVKRPRCSSSTHSVPLKCFRTIRRCTAMLGHVKRFGVAVEDVIDEPRGQVEEVFTAQRLHRLFHVHRVLEDAIEHQVANLVIVEGSGEDVLGSVPEGLAAAAP